MAPKNSTKLSLHDVAKKLTAIAERHLSTLSETEQEARVAAFARVKFKTSRGKRAKSSSTAPYSAVPGSCPSSFVIAS